MNRVVFLYCYLLCSTVYTQTTDLTEQEVPELQEILEEIVVQGDLVAKTATRVVITAHEIRERGVRTVAQALDYLPGSNIQIGSKGEASIILRGFNQREIAVLIDGIPVNSPYDGQIDLSALPIGDVERIEVIKGASSVLYGANVMGGVVNIITKKSTGQKLTQIQGRYGSGELTEMSASTQGAIGGVRFYLSGSYSDQAYYPLSKDYSFQDHEDGDARSNSDRQIWTGKAGLGWDVGENHRFALNISHIDQVKGVPHHESSSWPRFWRFNDWQQGGMDFIWDHFGNQYSLKAKFYHEFLDNILDSYDDATYSTQEGRRGWTDIMQNTALGSDLFFRYNLRDSLLVKSGLRFRQDKNQRRSDVNEPWEAHKLSTFSLPLEVEWQRGFFNLTSGFSYDVMSFEYGEEKNTNSFNPQIALLVHITDAMDMRGSISHKTRFPTVRELFSSRSGNPDLEPMHATSYEIGLEKRISHDWKIETTGFYYDISDLISWVSNSLPYLNIDEATFYGFELESYVHLSEKAVLGCSYTYLHTEDKSSTTKDRIEYRPEHKFNGNAQIDLPAKTTLNVNVMIVSSQIYYEEEEERHLDSSNLIDCRIAKEINERLHLHLEVRNLLDDNYYESEGFPREGRTIFGGFRFSF